MASWMGAKGTYSGPTLSERAEKRKASKLAFHVRTSKETTKQELREAFEGAGADVLDVRIVFRGNGASTGVGYVDVRDEASIQKGLELDGTVLHGEKLKVRRNMDRQSLKKLVAGWHDKSNGDSAEGASSSRTVTQKKGTCFAFQKGQCQRGDRCRFSHDEAPSSSTGGSGTTGADGKAQGQPLCRDFQKGKCRRANCRFWPCCDKAAGGTKAQSDRVAVEGLGKRARPKGAAYGQKPPPANYQVKKKQKIKNRNQKIHRAKSLSPEVQAVVDGLLKSRQAARDQKDWKEADRIRDELRSKGVVVKDTKTGPVLQVL